ncbi:unnamed protein product, partial [Mesorhabditis spiculigera]
MNLDDRSAGHLLSTIPEVSEGTTANTPEFSLTPHLPRAALGKLLRRANPGQHEIHAERLNLYLDRNEGDLENMEEDQAEAKKSPKERWKKRLRIVLPHVGLVLLSALYTLLGAAIFHNVEMPYEMQLRNESCTRVTAYKKETIEKLWNLRLNGFAEFERTADDAMDHIIRDVFHDYTKNYMIPDDIIHGDGPVKWSFGASIFFSWTAITTIGYGHIVPRTWTGRCIIVFYALIGIPLILVTIADMGRFLSGGIIWVHNTSRKALGQCWRRCWRYLKCCCCYVQTRRKRALLDHLHNQHHLATVDLDKRKLRKRNGLDNVSDAGTFEDISDIHNADSEGKSESGETNARADEVEFEAPHERRVSVIFVLFIMIGYVAGGAWLIRFWENWDFFDAFYFCFVTVTTIGFGDIVPLNADFFPLTLAYIVLGLIITTMCIDLVGSEYIRDIHFYGRSLGRSFMTIGGKVVHLGEVFGYVAFLQKNYGLTPEQLNKLAQLPEEYLLDCLINGRQPDLNWIGGRPYVPPDIYYFKWIEHPRTLSFASERVLASMESLDLNTSRCSTARTLTPREYYQRILFQYCKQMQPEDAPADAANEDRK